jgi:2-dehydropantoate 2-reductase
MSPSISERLNIAIIGAGGIGTGLAFLLAKAKHQVTLVARNARLAQLKSASGTIELASGEQVTLDAVVDRLDTKVEYDAVILAVLHSHVAALLPDLQASKAKKVITMFNIFAPLAPLRDALGAARFVPGFPAMDAHVDASSGRLSVRAVGWPLSSIVTDAKWAAVLAAAGVPTAVELQTESWLRTHVVVVALMLSSLVVAARQNRALSWSQASEFGRGVDEGFALIADLGGSVQPSWHKVFGHFHGILFALLLFVATRFAGARGFGANPRALEGPALIGDVVNAINSEGKGLSKHSTASIKSIYASVSRQK